MISDRYLVGKKSIEKVVAEIFLTKFGQSDAISDRYTLRDNNLWSEISNQQYTKWSVSEPFRPIIGRKFSPIDVGKHFGRIFMSPTDVHKQSGQRFLVMEHFSTDL